MTEAAQRAPGASIKPPLQVVAIGASAGGIPALQELLSALPAKLGAAVAVVIHLDPTHESELAAILATRTHMRVVQVTERLPLEADTVYVIAPNSSLVIAGDEIAPTPLTEAQHGQRTPIDALFRSLALKDGDGFAVVLTGNGSDGALGVSAVKAAGGIVLVQDPAEAEYPSMPQSAIASGADYVLPLRQIAGRLTVLIQTKTETATQPLGEEDEDVLRLIFAHLKAKTGQDFSKYKRATVMRRVVRRMQLVQAGGLASYLAYLEDHAEEVQRLFGDLLISVTSFLRDPSAFAALATQVIPRLFDRQDTRQDAEALRTWVAGCATGEEAYSIAILLLEEAERRKERRNFQIFASDLDTRGLAVARDGVYPAASVSDLGEDRLRRFFRSEGDNYRIRPEVRDLIVFAPHNFLKDPPFSHCDLIACRNVLIYLDRDLQEQAITIFSYALREGGFLFLGTSETADNPPGLFNLLNAEARLYQASEATRIRRAPLSHDLAMPPLPETLGRARVPRIAGAFSTSMHREALEDMAPPSMLVNEKHVIVNLSEQAGRYLILPSGPVTSDAVANVRPELALDLSAALHRAFEHNEPTLTRSIPVRFNGHAQSVLLKVLPRPSDDGPRTALVFFIEGGAIEEADPETAGVDRSAEVKQLREELFATRTLLRTSREQYEAASEQLRSANEELQSINEEYRSTAEELVTSKEELQSINSELQSVNNELKQKYDQEQRAHNDLRNLMGATDIATLFLDRDMRIKRFTPRTADLFNVQAGDFGRPISDFTHRLEYSDLVADAQRVLADLTPIERAIHSVDGRWFTTRFRPYRTIDDKIEGVVITFFDVTERREADAAWAQRQRLLLGELSHRVKNTLAVVQAVVRQSLRSSGAKAEAVTALLDRLGSLASSHDLLVRNDWKGASLEALANEQLGPYVQSGQLLMTGGSVILAPTLSTPLGLVLHELATNAAKYGALSTEAGKVDLFWRTLDTQGGPRLELTWRERGGPKVQPPAAAGTGTTLIEKSISGSEVVFDYDPQGLSCRITMPMVPGENL